MSVQYPAKTGGSGTVTSVSGTANQIDVATGTTTPVISIDSALIIPGSLATASIQPKADSTTALKLFKADGSTVFINYDTANLKLELGSTGVFSWTSTTAPAGTVDTGISRGTANQIKFGNGTQGGATAELIAGQHANTAETAAIDTNGASLGAGKLLNWSSGAGFSSAIDTGISRTGAAAIACGNGTQGDTSAIVSAGGFSTAGNITAGTAAGFRFGTTRSKIMSSSDGTLQLTNAAGTTGAVVTQLAIVTTPNTVANLPATPAEGSRAGVTDSNAASFALGIGAVVVGGGTTHVPVYYDGSNWRIG